MNYRNLAKVDKVFGRGGGLRTYPLLLNKMPFLLGTPPLLLITITMLTMWKTEFIARP